MEKTKEIKWINCAKFLAILAVITDHTKGILYTNQNIALASYFSVSLFIIISGMMSFSSNERHDRNWLQTFICSGKNIVAAYLAANLIYLIWIDRYFDLKTYLQYVIGFNLSPPFYYVLLYLQLMLINRPIYDIIKRIPEKLYWIWEIGMGIVILFISSLTTNYTNILNVYGGGGKIFGGTYLFLFYLGMLISKHAVFKNMTLKKSAILSAAGFLLWFGWWRFACCNQFALDAKLPFGGGFNPPSITLSVMAVIMLVLSCGVFSLLEYSKYLRWITCCTSWLGKHTLYIFLYHRFFLDYIMKEIRKYFTTENMWLIRIMYLGVMILGSILLDYLLHWTKKLLTGEIVFQRLSAEGTENSRLTDKTTHDSLYHYHNQRIGKEKNFQP